MSNRVDRGIAEASRHGITRSPHWESVERVFRESHSQCAACVSASENAAVQVHHINPFHYVISVGREDLELDPRNLISLCETEHDKPAPDHHLLLGHLGNFKEGNLRVAEDSAGEYRGLSEEAIRKNSDWLTEERQGRLKPLDQMTTEEKKAFRERLDRELPPDSEILAKYNITIS